METFLVRVWTPDGEERPEGMRGTAVHLSSGRSVTYTHAEALISFLAEAASGGDRDRPAMPHRASHVELEPTT
jgi:hypothetical protein